MVALAGYRPGWRAAVSGVGGQDPVVAVACGYASASEVVLMDRGELGELFAGVARLVAPPQLPDVVVDQAVAEVKPPVRDPGETPPVAVDRSATARGGMLAVVMDWGDGSADVSVWPSWPYGRQAWKATLRLRGRDALAAADDGLAGEGWVRTGPWGPGGSGHVAPVERRADFSVDVG